MQKEKHTKEYCELNNFKKKHKKQKTKYSKWNLEWESVVEMDIQNLEDLQGLEGLEDLEDLLPLLPIQPEVKVLLKTLTVRITLTMVTTLQIDVHTICLPNKIQE